jgi:signal peptidase II
MLKINFKEIFKNLLIILIIFFLDRLSKVYILKLAELEKSLDIYLTPYLNLYLIWNKGIAFGLFSFNETYIYNFISIVILIVILAVLVMLKKAQGIKKYSLIFVFGGSLGNFFDRIYYSAVPDFIDFHINNFHWFIFNVADIFISLGIVLLIMSEITSNKTND